MRTKQRMRPTSRPKQERRKQNTRQRPHPDYSNRKPVRREPSRQFHMPEDPLDLVPRWKLALATVAAVAALLAFGYLFGWSIGHFMKGWW